MNIYTCLLLASAGLLTTTPSKAQNTKPAPTKVATASMPDTFHAIFKTTKGDFSIEAYKTWAPKGVSRLFELINSGYFNNNVIFRVQADYVVQFGISDDTSLYAFWNSQPILDEPLQQPNKKGIISFASGGPNTRSNQLFINKKDNYKLDTINIQGAVGYPPVARVTSGWEVVEQFYGGHGREPVNHQDSAARYGNAYWEKRFPGLDKIIIAAIIL
ncbi:MAG: peptidylprolyl isomerase [Chitinophagaceae bacterium]